MLIKMRCVAKCCCCRPWVLCPNVPPPAGEETENASVLYDLPSNSPRPVFNKTCSDAGVCFFLAYDLTSSSNLSFCEDKFAAGVLLLSDVDVKFVWMLLARTSSVATSSSSSSSSTDSV